SRTQKLSSAAPMILGGKLPGKVGRCQLDKQLAYAGCFFLFFFTLFIYWKILGVSDMILCYNLE
ncbi:MAG: hypothetical protein U0K95_03680, partial [Eubacterium sp.]|nr:hypothetical protein [Eubacterium sp.]